MELNFGNLACEQGHSTKHGLDTGQLDTGQLDSGQLDTGQF